MKKILMSLGMLSILTTNTFGNTFGALTYGKSSSGQTINNNSNQNINFDNVKSYKMNLGSVALPIEGDLETEGVKKENNFDFYFGLGISAGDKKDYIYQSESIELNYTSYIFNIGKAFALNNYIILLGGVGIEHTRVSDNREIGEALFQKNKFNLNGGVLMFLYKSNLGIQIDYDSAPKNINIGLAYRF